MKTAKPKHQRIHVRRDKEPAYKNPKISVEKRVRDLLSRMTLQEKAAQMMCIWQQKGNTLTNEAGECDPAKARVAFKSGHGLGQVGRPSDAGKGLNARQTAELTNDIQRFFLENSRLGIPVIFHAGLIHAINIRERAYSGIGHGDRYEAACPFNPS